MSQLQNVRDEKGNRIDTDILVTGYIRDVVKEYELFIPDEISVICYVFWLIKACDEWDKDSSAEYIKIDGFKVYSTTRKGKLSVKSIYGCHSIDVGSYSWQIKFNTKITRMCIGVIKDDPKILRKHRHNVRYIDQRDGYLLDQRGHFFGGSYPAKYCKSFQEKDTIITMTLDMDNHCISYKCNDEDYGIAASDLKQNKYRLVVNLINEGDCVELL